VVFVAWSLSYEKRLESAERRALFERHRPILEMLASELFDGGTFQRDESTGKLVVRVPSHDGGRAPALRDADYDHRRRSSRVGAGGD
jgi:hypothetical protein